MEEDTVDMGDASIATQSDPHYFKKLRGQIAPTLDFSYGRFEGIFTPESFRGGK
jgi:hypothetical protein